MKIISAQFDRGQLVDHLLFDYHGVIVDVDMCFQGSEEWYQMVAITQPPKHKPWYRILVHNAEHETYVAERNLTASSTIVTIDHPRLHDFFSGFDGNRYVLRQHGH